MREVAIAYFGRALRFIFALCIICMIEPKKYKPSGVITSEMRFIWACIAFEKFVWERLNTVIFMKKGLLKL